MPVAAKLRASLAGPEEPLAQDVSTGSSSLLRLWAHPERWQSLAAKVAHFQTATDTPMPKKGGLGLRRQVRLGFSSNWRRLILGETEVKMAKKHLVYKTQAVRDYLNAYPAATSLERS